MDSLISKERPVAVIGAGVMGVGIAQVALLAGHPVLLFDARDGAAAAAVAQLGATLARLAAKGKLEPADVPAALARLHGVPDLAALSGAGLVIEAIVEDLAVKQRLLADLETVVADDCVLASNTSSLSITALARGLRAPARVVGMHFFNPVPLMRLVEVVSGLGTDPAVAADVAALALAWGKTPVQAASTPGFIVNRIARPFYAETLALLQQRAAAPAVLDACLRGAGFRMGPCELMDLIGHDTNFAVTRSVWEANFFNQRYQPSLVQRELVDGGRLGRKSGRGFYRYEAGAPVAPVEGAAPDAGEPAARGADRPLAALTLRGQGPAADLLAARLGAAGLSFDRDADASPAALVVGGGLLLPTDGRCAVECAAAAGLDDVAVFDWALGPAAGPAATPPVTLAYAVSATASAAFAGRVEALLRALGWRPEPLADVPGLVVARTLAMLVNEASDAVEQGVCDAPGADAAMTLGVNYPAGPFEWLEQLGAPGIVRLLDALDGHYRGERYRVSPRLRRASAMVRP